MHRDEAEVQSSVQALSQMQPIMQQGRKMTAVAQVQNTHEVLPVIMMQAYHALQSPYLHTGHALGASPSPTQYS